MVILREVRPLSELGFGDEFWDAYAQLLGCELCWHAMYLLLLTNKTFLGAHDRYSRKKILHHDISMSKFRLLSFRRWETGLRSY